MNRWIAVLALLSGCDLYWGGSGDDCEDDNGCCKTGDAGTSWAPDPLRNPATGECQDFGGGGGYGCDLVADISPPNPDWGACHGSCDALDEQSCLTATECYAAYYSTFGELMKPWSTFRGCWAIAPSGPANNREDCSSLDAYECSRHNDCSAVFGIADGQQQPDTFASIFLHCAPEPTGGGSCSFVDCGPGYRCEEHCVAYEDWDCQAMCVPDKSSCSTLDCGDGYTCVEQCTGMGGGNPDRDPSHDAIPPIGQCYPTCVPIDVPDPGSCTGEVTCLSFAPVVCPVNTTPGIKDGCYTGYCIPLDDCGPGNPGSCDGALCDSMPPACPQTSVPGVINGCWSGYCIPTHACPQATCEALTTENACTARGDCTPVYLGDDCTCYPGYCECNILTYERCASNIRPF